jgi:hypothetical protein
MIFLLSVIAFSDPIGTIEQNQLIDRKIPFFHGYPIVEYEQVNFSQMDLRKATEDPYLERNIYYDPATETFVKQWPPIFLRNQIFLRALISGYYKQITPLEAILFDREGNCRGYITKALDYDNLSLAFFTNKHNYICLEDVSKQNSTYRAFYDSLMQKTQETGLYYFDLVPSNIVTDHSSYYFVDLESVFTLRELQAMQRLRYEEFLLILDHLPPEYASFIKLAILNSEEQ